MRIGLYGGSFDPVHAGHVLPVRDARTELGLDRVIYLPTAHPPHKPERDLAPAHARYTMVELALLEEEGLYASAFELRGERCYTIESIRHFRRRWPSAGLVLLVGSDDFAELDRWREWRGILAEAELGVLMRPGWHRPRIERELAGELRQAMDGQRVRLLSNRRVPVSATELRRELAEGREPADGALHPLVLQYVRKYGLYRRE